LSEVLGRLRGLTTAAKSWTNLGRCCECIALAEKLDRGDLFKCRDSLHSFLRALAIAGRSSGPAT